MNTALRLVKGTDLEVHAKRDYINLLNQSEPQLGVLFTDFIASTIARKAKRMGESYQSNYKTLIYHVKNFSLANDANIFTNSVNEEFLDDFICYLQELGLKQTYIREILSLAKSMAKRAGTYGYAVDSSYEDVTLDDEDIYKVYLSMNVITRIYYFKGLTKKQQRIRDLFVLGCLTGLRYSDYSTLTHDNFTDKFIVKVTKKTNKKVIIPIHDYVREIFLRYNGNVSSGLSIQHFNRYIKSICRKVGLTDEVTYNYTKGGKLVMESKQMWQLVSSHTARRSFATNIYMTGRMKTFEIMSITGHTTEKSFFRYIRITSDDISRQISGDSFFRI
jgi:integrase